MDADTETVHEEPAVVDQIDQIIDGAEDQEEVVEEQVEQEQQVPLAALQKERKKRQEAEQRARLFEEIQAKQMHAQPKQEPEDDDSYETATRGELKSSVNKTKQETIQSVMEAIWVKDNPDKVNDVNEKLEALLKQRPNLKLAIEAAPNRYEEAWTLINALSPKQKQALVKNQTAIKKAAPGSPNAVPKAAGINQAVDLSSMSDTEFNEWRASKRKAR